MHDNPTAVRSERLHRNSVTDVANSGYAGTGTRNVASRQERVKHRYPHASAVNKCHVA